MADDGLNVGDSHAKCMALGTHICQVPSGRRCYEQPCDNPAGTFWGPYWCPEHDKQRLDGIGRNLEGIAASFSVDGSAQ